MKPLSQRRFLDCLHADNELPSLSSGEWCSLLRVLRHKSLAASFYARHKSQLNRVPLKLKIALESAEKFAHAQHIQTLTQARKLKHTLDEHAIPFVFLKGAAYVVGKTANAQGRLMTDIDICVNKKDIKRVEEVLLAVGWEAKNMDEHDEKYYREWSHELPPMVHRTEGVALDVHHTLLPPVSGRTIDIENLIDSSAPPNEGVFAIPPKPWLIFHSSVHLLLNEEVDNGLRDLNDIYILLTSDNDSTLFADTALLFKEQGFEQEWKILVLLLVHYFSYKPQSLISNQDLSLRGKLKLYVVKRCLIPDTPFIENSSYSIARIINYFLGYTSKMPMTILLKQFSYKTYRATMKFVFGDFYFRPKSDN